MDKINLTGKAAIVTGAGGGMGRCHAIDLARHGARVVVNDIGAAKDGTGLDKQPAMTVAAEIKAAGGEAIASFDNIVTDAAGIVKTAVDAFGTVDILVNNAGIVHDMAFMKMDDNTWDAVIDVNLKGTYACIKAAWPFMREKKYGRIVNISSGSGLFGNYGQANYAAAKIAVAGLANVLKLEGSKYNIHINVVAPVATTRLNKEVMPPEMLYRAKPELVSSIVTYLCSEECRENGSIFNAGLGFYSKSAIMTGRGWFGGKEATAEDIMQNFDKIKNMENPKFFYQIEDMFKEFFLK